MASASYERLQLNLLSFFEMGKHCDITIIAQGKEIQAHKAILCSQSTWFDQALSQPGQNRIEMQQKYKVVHALVRFMYFGGVNNHDSMGPDDGLDMLTLSEELGIKAMDSADILPLILPRLTKENCFIMMEHESLARYPELGAEVCKFIGNNFASMLTANEGKLQSIPGPPSPLHVQIMKSACHHVKNDQDTLRLVNFCLQHTRCESACDLLRETKQWNWGTEDPTLLRSLKEEQPEEGFEWLITNVRSAMETTPARLVVGNFFNWQIRLDYGSEGKLRIVYESADLADMHSDLSIDKFPAAMFAWRVLYRGQDVFNEKPVFICFPKNVQLHWSTTLPVTAAELSDDDDLRIMVNMAENPMLSLILSYFSGDLKTVLQSEDILNRLPHIEYRCLSSYALVQSHGG